jgi:hypothetical protein
MLTVELRRYLEIDAGVELTEGPVMAGWYFNPIDNRLLWAILTKDGATVIQLLVEAGMEHGQADKQYEIWRIQYQEGLTR